MQVHEGTLQGVLFFDLDIFRDPPEYARGEVFELYNYERMRGLGLPRSFGANHVSVLTSRRGALRGIHGGPVGKLVSVLTPSDKVFAAILDGRTESSTFGQVETFELTYGHALYVPAYCGNSALTISDTSTYLMAFDVPWEPDLEDLRINPLDAELRIPWPLPREELTVHPRDLEARTFFWYALECGKQIR